MSTQSHWEHVYGTKSPVETSWYTPHLLTSVEWITRAAPDPSAAIIDVGAGESTLVDDLHARHYRSLSILDISDIAIQRARKRLGTAAEGIQWMVGNVLEVSLPRTYDLWHDRAVFHFLTEPESRHVYLQQLTSSLKPGGRAIIAGFGPDGPQKCSGLPTQRYSAESLQRELGSAFRLIHDALIEHQTPFGTKQQFLYCDFQLG